MVWRELRNWYNLSNSIYMIIAKVLANRLHEVIDVLVGPFQSAFIPGRQLVDSAVVQETERRYLD